MRCFDDLLEYELGDMVQLINAPKANPRNNFETGTKGKIVEFFENGLIDVVLDWNKSLQEGNKQLKQKVEGYERVRNRLVEIGFPTFMSCKEYAEKIDKLKCCANCKHSEEDNKSSTSCDECFELCYWEMKE